MMKAELNKILDASRSLRFLKASKIGVGYITQRIVLEAYFDYGNSVGISEYRLKLYCISNMLYFAVNVKYMYFTAKAYLYITRCVYIFLLLIGNRKYFIGFCGKSAMQIYGFSSV